MITTIKEIFGENASQHWWFLDVKDKVVLDLGCGIWYSDDPEEYTPMYFERNGASKVIGVDADCGYFIDKYEGNPKYEFIGMRIDCPEHLRELLQQYRPDVLKMDIEGYEMHMEEITAEDMSSVTEIGFEWHSDELKAMLLRKLREWGFSSSEDSNLDTGVLFHAKR